MLCGLDSKYLCSRLNISFSGSGNDGGSRDKELKLCGLQGGLVCPHKGCDVLTGKDLAELRTKEIRKKGATLLPEIVSRYPLYYVNS